MGLVIFLSLRRLRIMCDIHILQKLQMDYFFGGEGGDSRSHVTAQSNRSRLQEFTCSHLLTICTCHKKLSNVLICTLAQLANLESCSKLVKVV